VGSILVVQSDPDSSERLSGTLRQAGHEVIMAFAVREAALRLAEGGIDVVVIDAYDPRVGLPELARHMETLPDAPPLVLVSASPHAPEISARIGAAAFIPKPYEATDIVVGVDRVAGSVRPVRVIDEEDEPTGPVRHIGS
jgi:DNA-binding NtrC family response regulator